MKAKRINAICSCGDHGFSQLTRGMTALFSPEDYDLVKCHNWYVSPSRGIRYACRRAKAFEGKHTIRMHRHISDDCQVDHINSDGLDNRRENLRKCTQAENTRNTRPWGGVSYKGVDFHKITGKYRARIRIDGATRQLGVFDDPESAARAYNDAAMKVFGQFAYLNEV